MSSPIRILALLFALATACSSRQSLAEPYLAVRSGLQCGACHVNPTGGGLRNLFGDIYAQTQLPQQQIDMGERGLWQGKLNDFLRIGSDLRYDASFTNIPHEKRTDAFAINDFRVYGAADLIQNRLTLYVDELLAPGGAETREAYALLWFDNRRFYFKAGKLYLPYGLRLQDDEAFVRQVTGINYTTPDNGLELGWQLAALSAQLALSNGAAGAAENDQGKQATANLVYVKPIYRLGASFNFNDAAAGKRSQQGLYAGLRTGPVAWLAEADYITDSSLGTGRGRLKQWTGLIEADWAFLPGNNLKLTAEYLDPDVSINQNQQNRFSAVWEYAPIQFLQTRLGLRKFDGIPQNDLQNRTEVFLELHGFF